MSRALLLIVIVLILVGSGTFAYLISQQPAGAPPIPGMRVQTNNPAASALVNTPEKGTLFVLFAGFVVFNLVGMGATIAIIAWFLDKQLRKVRHEGNKSFSFSLAERENASLGGVLARRPAITIGIFMVLVIGAALTLALLGFFTPR